MRTRITGSFRPWLLALTACAGCATVSHEPLVPWEGEVSAAVPLALREPVASSPTHLQAEGEYTRTDRETPHLHDCLNRVSLFLDQTAEGDEREFTPGVEYERHLDHYWGVGGFLEHFDGEDDYLYLAFSVLYHPVPEVGFSLSPGVQFLGDENRFAVRAGTNYEFELAEPWTFGPAVYVEFIEGGARASVIGLALSYNF
jgi:hypothetical protein